MYSDEEEKKGFPIRDFLLKLVLVIIFVLLLMWLLPTRINNKNGGNSTDISPLTDRIFNANIQEMKAAAIPYFTTERLPKNTGDEVKMSLQRMLDLKLLLPFTDKNGDTCNTQESYVLVTKEENEYLMKVYLKCGDESDYILVHIGCYSYCTTENGVCEKQDEEPAKKPVVTNGPSCSLEIASGKKGSNGWYVGNVVVRFKNKSTTTSGAKITAFGMSTSSVANYNSNNETSVTKDGTTKVYGFVKDSNGKTSVCSITVKKDTVDPDCSLTVLKGNKKSNGNYLGTVTVGFAKQTDGTSGIAAYGLDINNKVNYNSKKTYAVSKVGKSTIYGFVKDKAGHTKVCTTSVTIDAPDPSASTPSCSLEVSSGKVGLNGWYVNDTVVRFKNKTSTNGATIVSYGLDKKENYNGLSSYTVKTDGTNVIKGYVRDSNGNTATCSITVKRDATKPSCSLGVISGTKSSNGLTYSSDIVIGFGSRNDATSGINSYGIGKSTTYGNNSTYTITTSGKHVVYGYVKDNAGNTNVCSINVEKKIQSYEYQYVKNVPVQYSNWSNWQTKEYNCSNPPAFGSTDLYQSIDKGKSQSTTQFEYKTGPAVYGTLIKQTGTVREKTCSGWKYYRSTTNSTKTYAILAADEEFKFEKYVTFEDYEPQDSLTVHYEFVSDDWGCGTCTTSRKRIYKKYVRNVSVLTATDTITKANGTTVKCTSFETNETKLFTTYRTIVGYDQIRTPKTVCTYSYRTRTILTNPYQDFRWSYYNDSTLLNNGYVMTGNKRLAD